MTGPVTTEALVAALADYWRIARRWPLSTASDIARDLVAGPLAPLLAALQQATAERDEYAEALMKVAEVGGWQASAGLYAEVQSALARLRAEGEAKDRRIAALEAALAPFAKAGGLFGPRQSNGWDVLIYNPAAGEEYCITADHLRAARAATAREGA